MKNYLLSLACLTTIYAGAQSYGLNRVTDICPDACTGVRGISSYKGLIYFSGKSPSGGVGLWRSDGTTAGTYLVKEISSDFNSSSNYFTEGPVTAEGLFYFGAADGPGSSFYLWRSDGTSNGTFKLTGPQAPFNIVELNGFVVFGASTQPEGIEIWRSDGTQQGTFLIKDINPGTASSLNNVLYYNAVLNNKLFFVAKDGIHGLEAWVTDGTANGTYMIKDICVGSCDSYFHDPLVYHNALYFAGAGGVFKTTGAPGDPVKVLNVYWNDPVILNDIVYFHCDTYQSGVSTELYSATLTNTIVTLIKDIFPGPSGSYPSFLTAINGKLYFNANDGVNGGEVWVSDGTTAGTKMLKAIDSNTYSTIHTSSFRPANGKVYFTGRNTDVTGTEIWETDGTEAGTKVYDIFPGAGGNVINYRDFNNELYITANDGQTGNELWKIGGPLTGIQSNGAITQKINLFPNPTSGNFHIAVPDHCQMEFYDPTGKLISTRVLEAGSNEVDISTYPEGIYLIRVADKGIKVIRD